MKNKLYLILSLILFCSCNGQANKGMPDWYETREIPNYPKERYIIGYASGPFFRARGIQAIERDAKGDIARQIRSEINSKLEFLQYSATGRDGKEEFGDNVFSIVKEESTLVISNIKRLAQHVDNEQEKFYVAIGVDRKELASNYRVEAYTSIQMMKNYEERPEKLRELFFIYNLKEKLRHKIQRAKLNGRLYGSTHFKPLAMATPENPLTDYRLTFTDASNLEHKEQITKMLSKILVNYGVTFSDKSTRKILCDFKVSEVKGGKYPTAVATLTLYEVTKDNKHLVYTTRYPDKHPAGFEHAKNLIIETRLPTALKGQLNIDIDRRTQKLIDSRLKKQPKK